MRFRCLETKLIQFIEFVKNWKKSDSYNFKKLIEKIFGKYLKKSENGIL